MSDVVYRHRHVIALALLPMTLALGGGWIDEQARLGFSNWRAACRAAGFSLQSIAWFTFELLPGALIGALMGGLCVLLYGVLARRRHHGAHAALAAHAGCALAMVAGLFLCALALPVTLVLGIEALLASIAAGTLLAWFRAARASASVKARTRGPASA